jgi:uncharacterized protein (DUF2147 family)
MKRLLLTLTLIFGLAPAAQAQSYSPEGLWLTENERSAIFIKKCGPSGSQLCGYIDWIIDGGMQFDVKNPDDTMHGEPLCGKQIMYGLRQNPSNPNEWVNGNVYKADDGDVYDAKVEVLGPDTLKVRGYRGISVLGKTQMWKRVSVDQYPRCIPPAQ